MVVEVLALAFIPLAIAVAKWMLPSLRPQNCRPAMFAVFGAFLFLFGVLGAYSLKGFIETGVVSFTNRRLGIVFVDVIQQPAEYWLVVLFLYGIAVFVSGVGLAGVRLSYRKACNRNP
jgi:hypothetical protein